MRHTATVEYVEPLPDGTYYLSGHVPAPSRSAALANAEDAMKDLAEIGFVPVDDRGWTVIIHTYGDHITAQVEARLKDIPLPTKEGRKTVDVPTKGLL